MEMFILKNKTFLGNKMSLIEIPASIEKQFYRAFNLITDSTLDAFIPDKKITFRDKNTNELQFTLYFLRNSHYNVIIQVPHTQSNAIAVWFYKPGKEIQPQVDFEYGIYITPEKIFPLFDDLPIRNVLELIKKSYHRGGRR